VATKNTDAAVTPVAGSDGLVFRAVLSDPAPDCVGDRVTVVSWSDDLRLLVGHDTSKPPVAFVRARREGGRFVGELVFPPAGTSAASDDARRLIASGVADRVSIGFRTLKPGKGNDHGGYDLEAHVHEVSLVGVGCCDSCRIGKSKGKPEPVLMVIPSPKPAAAKAPDRQPVYTVRPEDVVRAILEALPRAIDAEVSKAVNYLRGRLPDDLQDSERLQRDYGSLITRRRSFC
jgi:hypothetical protein